MKALKLAFLTLAAALILCAVTVFPQKPCFESGESYTFFVGSSSKDCKVVTVTENVALEKLLLKDVCGECTEYKDFDLDDILKKYDGEILFSEELSDSVNYYCRANLPYSVNLYGKEINLHISVRGDSAKIASPIIFGGY